MKWKITALTVACLFVLVVGVNLGKILGKPMFSEGIHSANIFPRYYETVADLYQVPN